MRKIIQGQKPLNLTIHIDKNIRKEINDLIQKQLELSIFSFSCFSDFLKQSIKRYKNRKLKPQYCPIKDRMVVVVRFKENDLEAYNFLPEKRKYHVMNSLLRAQLDEEWAKLK